MEVFNGERTMKFQEYYMNEENAGVDVGTESYNNTMPSVDIIAEYVLDSYSDRDPDDDNSYAVAEEIHGHLMGIYESAQNIPVYRCVQADEVDLDPYGIGESWSAYLDSAKEFGSHLGASISKLKIISGLVPRGNVDWDESAKLYIEFSDLGGESEFELRIPSNNKILGVRVEPYKMAVER
jgi:hypothetical protein